MDTSRIRERTASDRFGEMDLSAATSSGVSVSVTRTEAPIVTGRPAPGRLPPGLDLLMLPRKLFNQFGGTLLGLSLGIVNLMVANKSVVGIAIDCEALPALSLPALRYDNGGVLAGFVFGNHRYVLSFSGSLSDILIISYLFRKVNRRFWVISPEVEGLTCERIDG
jgi:hypothetical protein